MSLAARVRVARRFQRAIRVDNWTSHDPAALEGFVCPRSSAVVLQTMARHIAETGQARLYLDRAVWHRQVEPGGCLQRGLERPAAASERAAVMALEPDTAEVVVEGDATPRPRGGASCRVVGSRGRPAPAVGKALQAARLVRTGSGWWLGAMRRSSAR